MSINTSSSDLDNEELLPVSGSFSQNVWSSSDSDNGEEEKVSIYDPENSD